jgi:carboxyl-terminal processing protease
MSPRRWRYATLVGLACLACILTLAAAPAENVRSQEPLAGVGEPMIDSLRIAAGTSDDAGVREDARRQLSQIEGRRPQAVLFADRVLKIAEMMESDSVLEPTPADLTASAVWALYETKAGPLPADLEARARRARIMSRSELHALLWDAAARVDAAAPLDPEATIEAISQRWLHPFDPFAEFIGPDHVSKFRLEPAGNFVGVGIELGRDPMTGLPCVVLPVPGSPSHLAGVRSGDILTHVARLDRNGGPEVVSTEGLGLEKVAQMILGEAKSKVRLTVRRRGREQPLVFDLLRGPAKPETVLGARRDSADDWDYWLDREGKIGYVRIMRFDEETFETLRAVLDNLEAGGLKGFVLDLRFTPGGLLTSAVDVADLFIDDGLIVSVHPRAGPETRFEGKHEGSRLEFPMACLVNGYSSGGSEFVAACLQDHSRAVIVGERAEGKGCVQNIRRCGDGQLKLTTAYFVRPNGMKLTRLSVPNRDPDEWGVTPDKGYALDLRPDERCRLRDHLEAIRAIPSRGDDSFRPALAFTDRQLHLALDALRS